MSEGGCQKSGDKNSDCLVRDFPDGNNTVKISQNGTEEAKADSM
jgi:hypothetical protein